MEFLRSSVDRVVTVGGDRPHQIARTTLALGLGAVYIPKAYSWMRESVQEEGVVKALLRIPLSFATKSGLVASMSKQHVKGLEDGFTKLYEFPGMSEKPPVIDVSAIPEHGMSKEKLMDILKQWSDVEVSNWNTGKVSGAVYHGGLDLRGFLSEVMGLYSLSNPLHADVFMFTRLMEKQVIRMTCSLFNGDANTCGSLTSGGTESILLAMKAYRDRGRERGISLPEILVSRTAHAAFEKACQLFGIRLKQAKIDEDTGEVDLEDLKRKISSNTVVIVGSAPAFPHGIIDPIEAMSEIALKHNIGLHVDCCLGGFLVPFISKINFEEPVEIPPFDFRVSGVTSISADTHKYGYSPKGTSLVLYRNKELRKHQFSLSVDWTGGVYATPTLAGSRPGGPIAATWAAMMHMGQEGYKEIVHDIVCAARNIKRGLDSIYGVKVIGSPLASVVAFTTDKTIDSPMNIYAVCYVLKEAGWHLNKLQNPSCVHIACTKLHTPEVVEEFLKAVRVACNEVQMNPEKYKNAGDVALYGAAESLPSGTGVLDQLAIAYLDAFLDA